MERGYVRLYRKTLDSRIMVDPTACQVWVWCLLKATYKPRQVRGVQLEPGQFLTGRASGATELQMAQSTWYSAMKRLEKWKQIRLSVNSSGTIVSICNWRTYQEQNDERQQHRQQDGQQLVNSSSTARQQLVNTNKKESIKEGQSLNNLGCVFPEGFDCPEVRGALDKWDEWSRSIGKATSDLSRNELLYAAATEGLTPARLVERIRVSIRNQWRVVRDETPRDKPDPNREIRERIHGKKND